MLTDKVLNLKIKIFADGANVNEFITLSGVPRINGFTTNPSLMRKAGITNYETFIEDILPIVGDKPLSLEVVSDDFSEMKKQAIKLSKYGENIYVKIPIMNTQGKSSIPLISNLINEGIKVNVTAIMTIKQVAELSKALSNEVPSIVSVFAGRIADTGIDPIPLMKQSYEILEEFTSAELLWASSRELLNIFQAEEVGCKIITIIPEILKKLDLVGYDLNNYSLDTVKMFYKDAMSAELKL